MARVNEG